jgi:hypothetical protein
MRRASRRRKRGSKMKEILKGKKSEIKKYTMKENEREER